MGDLPFMNPPPRDNRSWMPVTRHGVLVKVGDKYVVVGPWKHRDNVDEIMLVPDSLAAELGTVVSSVEVINWQELYERVYDARNVDDQETIGVDE